MAPACWARGTTSRFRSTATGPLSSPKCATSSRTVMPWGISRVAPLTVTLMTRAIVAYLANGARRSASLCGLATVGGGEGRRRRELEHAVDRFGEPGNSGRCDDDSDDAPVAVDERAAARARRIRMVEHEEGLGADALLPADELRANALAENAGRPASQVPRAEAFPDGNARRARHLETFPRHLAF